MTWNVKFVYRCLFFDLFFIILSIQIKDNIMRKMIVFFKLMLFGMAWLVLFYSCHVEDDVVEPVCTKAVAVNDFVLDTVYLEIKGDLNDPEIIWGHKDIYIPAYTRLARHLTFENNRIEWDFSSAEEVSVSQNIYDYVTRIWTYHNSLLESGEYILIPDGIYYRIESDKPTIMPLTPQVLIKGQHRHNMMICADMVQHITRGWLADYIDINSGLTPDGWGGWTLYGRGDSGLGRVWQYYVCFPEPLAPYHPRNEIVGFETQDSYMDFKETLFNQDQMPLVTVSNRLFFRL